MHPHHLRHRLLAVVAGWLMTFTVAHAQDAEGERHQLQVQVNVPAEWQPMFEDRLTAMFVAHLAEVFRREGYTGRVTEVHRIEEPVNPDCLLTIHLVEWRANHTGGIECTFTANAQTENRARHLGIFSGLALRWMSGPGRFGLADTFEKAADDALAQLYRSLTRADVLPGFARKN